MDSEQRRKRKRGGRPYNYFSFRSLVLLLTFALLVFVVSNRFPFNPASFRPVLGTHFLYSSASNSLLDHLNGKRQSSSVSFSPVRVEDYILFPDRVLIFVPNTVLHPQSLDCVYSYNYDGLKGSQPELGYSVRPAISVDQYNEYQSIVRCPLLPGNFSRVDLRWRDGAGGEYWSPANRTALNSWNRLVYKAEIDGDTVVVFVKGLHLRPHKKYDPSPFRCRFGLRNSDGESEGFALSTPAIAVAQEIVRCGLPKSMQINPEKAKGVRVTVSQLFSNAKSRPVRVTLPSVARIYDSNSDKQSYRDLNNKKKHELCACTMVWNQASTLKEWIMYHSWLGVGKWFIYDNNSDDGIGDVVQELDGQGYNVTRGTWPWIKTQEAGFSHCALQARDECNWVGFFDVDEFFFLPHALRSQGSSGQNALGELVANFSSSDIIGEIRTTCHSFGPSGLSSPPSKGVTVGYTCRLLRPERHKSIVRPDLLDDTLLNVVHHFKLKEGYRYLNVPESTAFINHYKYQVWETFRAKFYRRVATYVADWREDQNKNSQDRTPGLGTEAIEPPNWRHKFCDVWDYGLRNFVLANFADPASGSLPWEEKSQAVL